MKESYICSDIYLEYVKVVKMSKMLTKVENFSTTTEMLICTMDHMSRWTVQSLL